MSQSRSTRLSRWSRVAVAMAALTGLGMSATAQAASTPEQVAQMRKVFERLDRNGDGRLDPRELRRMNFTREQLVSADANRDMTLDPGEFVAMMEAHFGRVDRNGNGTLERWEMRRAGLGQMTREEMERIDRDNDGTLDLSEYIWASTRRWAPREGW